MSLVQLQRETLRERAYRSIQRAIVSGELAPGSRILDHEIAARFGVSRTPVREALQRLEDEGLLVTRAGSSLRSNGMRHGAVAEDSGHMGNLR